MEPRIRASSAGAGCLVLKVVVAGAGIFGLAASLELRERGHDVTLVAPGPIPHPLASSTDLSKMVRADYGLDETYVELMNRAFVGWHKWNQVLGARVYHETGFLVMGLAGLELGSFEGDSFQTLLRHGYPLEPVERDRLPPVWGRGDITAYFNRRGGWAASGEAIKRLLDLARSQGIDLVQATVTRLALDDFGCKGVMVDDDVITADWTVVAAGTWTAGLVPGLSPLVSIVGQPIVMFEPADPEPFASPGFPPWAADIANTGFYGFPATDSGLVKVANHGAGIEISPDEPRQLEPNTIDHFRDFLQRWLPALAAAPVADERLCLYTDTADGDFLIDRHPQIERLAVATGGSGHGFKFGPVLGGLIADVVEDISNPFVARFEWSADRQPGVEAARAVS